MNTEVCNDYQIYECLLCPINQLVIALIVTQNENMSENRLIAAKDIHIAKKINTNIDSKSGGEDVMN